MAQRRGLDPFPSPPVRLACAETGNPMVREALAYMARGWAVGPTWGLDPSRPSGCACPDPGCNSPGKHPVTRHGCKDFSTSERLARIWWERQPSRGVALATGEPSGVWALDVDGEAGAVALGELTARHGRLPDTVTSRTGGGGWHLLYRMPEARDVRNSASRVAPSVDVRGTGGYIVLPPSGHVSGRGYEWLAGRGPHDLPLADAPSWLSDLVAPPEVERTPAPMPDAPRGSRYVRAAIEAECRELARTPQGSRNDRLNVAAFNLARFITAGEADAPAVARALAHAAAQAGLGEREIARTLESAFGARGAV